ncbi:transglycosylase SLT domain-containing protein [uncultured Desulfovibrio sp.]|uniref:transglycosylase SLT domain-containing protein n=1 Tax=uncultured Desulfovibrio sp. TaxID=167968 RepID=UPI00272A6B46|nr:transglycosylase SLT domain-containing protein [uncultured Desulfovibrio sp.]
MWARIKAVLVSRWPEVKERLRALLRYLATLFWEALWLGIKLMLTGFLVGVGFWLALSYLCSLVHAAEVTIPRAAQQYRATLTRAAHATWGMDAPVSVLAAQIHTESGWNNEARSPVGAQGLAQFMPSTAVWLPEVAPETGKPEPFNPGWSLRALCTYDRWLWERNDGASDYERMAFTLSAYNGGQGWVNRDKKLARQRGLDAARWFGGVETVNAGRSAAAFRENRNYPRLILQKRQYAYIRAGWGPGIEDGARP